VSDHIEVSHLKKFMLGEEQLTEQEKGHLLHCRDCMAAMAEATLEHLEAEGRADKTADSK
jgi:hypothetical protein